MIDVQLVVQEVPHFETLCSVEKLHGLVVSLLDDERFAIDVAGTSANGVPIYHVRFGSGAVKAMVIGGPHCPEQIGSLTVFSLLTLLHRGNRALLDANIEWHIVPCADPDGAILNEGWTQKPFSLESFMRNYYEQADEDQVDKSFPIVYKKVNFSRPTQEAKVLRGLLDQIRPDFLYSLHNSPPDGGAWYAISRNIDKKYYQQLYGLLEQHNVTRQIKASAGDVFGRFSESVVELPSLRKYYDYLERLGVASPEPLLQGRVGAGSGDYLASIKEGALIFCTELVPVKHPSDSSNRPTGQHLRQLMLRLSADNMFLAASIVEEWERVQEALDPASPLYRMILKELVALKGRLHESLPGAWVMGRQLPDLVNSCIYGKTATEGERFSAFMWRFKFLCHAYGFVRLLKSVSSTSEVERSIERLDGSFAEALEELKREVDFNAFEIVNCDTLGKVQLGSGLIALNSVLEVHAS